MTLTSDKPYTVNPIINTYDVKINDNQRHSLNQIMHKIAKWNEGVLFNVYLADWDKPSTWIVFTAHTIRNTQWGCVMEEYAHLTINGKGNIVRGKFDHLTPIKRESRKDEYLHHHIDGFTDSRFLPKDFFN